MDYDKNDFQGHNNRLGGEEGSKLSPALQPYTLPKFDFDDNLQGHLRFDTLVENEVFLGISNQDDNEWIEDFSRGSSGIEFSSSATESCSISRCNNVWSEATSSESVEMLLKSVGQGEAIVGAAIIEESDAVDDLGKLTENAERNLKQYDKMKDNSVTQPALSTDNVIDGANGYEDSAEADHPSVVCTSEAKRDNAAEFGCSVEVNSDIVIGVIVNKRTAEAERKHGDKNQIEVEMSGNKLQTDNMKELSSISAVHIDKLSIENATSVSHNVFGSSGEINSEHSSYQVTNVSAENANAVVKDNINGMVEYNDQSKDSNVVDQKISGNADATCTNKVGNPLCIDRRVESLIQQKVVIDVTTSDEPSGSPVKVEHRLHLLEESKTSMVSAGPSEHLEAVLCTKGEEMCNHFQGSLCEVPDVVRQGDRNPKEKVADVDYTEAAIFPCPEQEVDAVKEKESFKSQVVSLEAQNTKICIKEAEGSCPEVEVHSAAENDMFLESNVQMDTDVLEGSVFVDHKSGKRGIGSADNLIEDRSSLTGACSVELVMEQPLNKDTIPKECKSYLTHVESEQPKEKELSSEAGDVHKCGHVTFPESQNVGVQTESVDMECKVVGSLSSDECGEGNILKPHGSEFSRLTEELASNADERNPNLSLCNTPIGGTGVAADADTTNEKEPGLSAHEENIGKPDGSEFSSITKELGSSADGKHPDLSLGNTLNGGTGLAANADTTNVQKPEATTMAMEDDNEYAVEIEGHKGTGPSCPKESLEVAAGQESVDKDGTATQGDQAVAEAGKECAKNLEVCSVSFDSTVKHGGGTETAESEKHSKILMERNAEASAVEVPESVAVSMTPKTQITGEIGPSIKETVAICMTEPFLDHKKKNTESSIAPKTQITGQIGPSVKDGHPSIYGSESLNGGESGNVYLIEDNCAGQQLPIKETTKDSVQLFKAISADGTDKSVPSNSGDEATRRLSSLTSEVRPSSSPDEGKTTNSGQSVHNIQADKLQMDIETSKSTPIDLKMSELSQGTPQPPVGGTVQVGVKGTPERKARRASGKTAVRSVKKRNSVKETTPVRQSDKGDKSLVLMRTPGTGQLVQFQELKSSGDVAQSGSKPLGYVPIPTSNLPDLNTSAPAAAFFQQPFTNLQQVQLRAQIIVYGSLIQDSAPDEACMVSAFGPSEGGSRNLWETAWRACVERVQLQKSLGSKLGTPIQSRSGSKAPVQPLKHSALQNKVLLSPAAQASSKRLPSPAVSPIMPLSSPLWNVSTLSSDGSQSRGLPRGGSANGHQTLSPMHPYQAPGIMNVVGQSPSWLSQSPFPSPWMTSPQPSAFDANAHFSMFPNSEPMKLTTAKDSHMTVSSFPATKPASFAAVIYDNRAATVSTGTSQPVVSKVAGIPRSADSKARKRKKVPATEDLTQMPFVASNQGALVCPPGVSSQLSPIPKNVGQKLLIAQSRTESVPIVTASTVFSTSVAVTAPNQFTSASNSGKFPATISPAISSDQPQKVDQNVEKSIVAEETSNTVEEARLHAETAALQAANAVSRYHDVWSQLAKQKKSGLISDVEAKISSAAVAITAATSVAKAAAAAAKIASNVALQAKMMADEVSSSSAPVDPTPSNSSSKVTSSAILKAGDGSLDPSSIIAVAKEVAKKRVEAASAASKHAENLDAIVKAAELAAEAVSQAGKILSIGDSSPLSELNELGTVGTQREAKKPVVDSDQPKAFSIELYNFSAEESKGASSGKISSLENVSFGVQRGNRSSELAETTGVIHEPGGGSRTGSVMADDAFANAAGLSIGNGVDEGCVVEVFRDCGNCKAAWYSANILNLKDGKAFLCYTNLKADDGTGLLKEWVPLQGDCMSTPTIRIAHPTTTMRLDGTRRKRKAAVMDYCWSVGDRVDAWTEGCWREGIVKEKNKIDETTLTIQFPATGDTSVVRAWHLRPTLIWQDGKWTECSSPRHHSPFQGDRPQEKRVRLSSPIEARGKDKIARGADLVELAKHDKPKLLPLSENEIEFDAGKDTIRESKLESRRTMRTGLQKEGSRVVFGVPKPGKKRKFMDVSKHFDSDQSSKNIKTGDSHKVGRYVTPQISGSHGWKNSTKIDVKDKKAAEDKPKVIRSVRPPSTSARALPRKENSMTSVKPTQRDATVGDKILEDAISNEENDTSQQNMMEFGSVSDSQDTSEGQTLAYSQGLSKVARKRGSSSSARSERLNKGKSIPSVGRIGKKVELQEKLVPEVAEPRRSNRTIQPTSRLLEGLQSSLSISKIPFSQDKTHRSQSRSKF